MRRKLPDELLALAVNAGAKSATIRRYEESFAMFGCANTLSQIRQENWFRARWHRRHSMGKELRKAMEGLK